MVILKNNKFNYKKMKKILFVITFIMVFSCNDGNINSFEQLKIDDLKREVIYDRDEVSYGVLLDLNANDSLNYESLSFSLLFADKENAHANLMVFTEMIKVFNKKKFSLSKFNDLSQINKDFAIYHLKKSANLGNISGQIYLEKIYRKGIGIERNEVLADSLLCILKKRPGYTGIFVDN